MNLDRLKTRLEILALACGALYLIINLGCGQFHSGMKVGIDVQRNGRADLRDLALVNLTLERTELGRIILTDVVFEIRDLRTNKKLGPSQVGPDERILEDQEGAGDVHNPAYDEHMALPPGDGASIAYALKVPEEADLIIEATLCGKRKFFHYFTIPFIGHAHWKVSAISLKPEPTGP